jgi:poly-gamma-glutamate synthesis protein (capsule biosynthesis protein)
MSRTISIALAGDVMLGRGVNMALRQDGAAWPWGNVLPFLKESDLSIINLECVIASSGRPWSRWRKVFHFRADPVAVRSLLLAGIDGVVLANNHVLDYEEEAFLEMLDLLDRHNIAHVGAGRNIDEARRPVLLDTQGLRVGLVSFTDNEPGWIATEFTPGTNWIDISLKESSLKPVRDCIDQARTGGADLVIFSIHWGPNMVERPSALFRKFAHAVIDAGADVYHGHSAHVFQGIEIYQGRPMIYDAGDFVDDYAVDPRLRNDRGLLFLLQVAEKRVQQIELIPVRISDCQVNLATGEDKEAIADRIRDLSTEMGTKIMPGKERLWIDCKSSDRGFIPG